MDLLARREHSVRELARKLTARGHAEAVVVAALAALEAEGLLSDARFAESFVHSRRQRGAGPRRIRAELRERGVADGLIDTVLAAHAGAWQELARVVRAKRFGAGPPQGLRERARQVRFLQGRGFENGQVRAAIEDADADDG